ncbi:DUF3291 domain-containing protein [Pseudomonas sp. KU43P]|uniref:DUF3291 domain-containing protein n=1 Tax=Pseudomonas sp. KU43P TaxID=2487887 RepID=UPI0012A8A6E3|nr:DUF3291 domain-containing protein [Pseudomonas sp. KU43P]BBH45428.1 hypothetical protein KU43P_19050 [Pseudomonas sp. KU43P]
MTKILAQFDLVKPKFPRDDRKMDEFYNNVDYINKLAESSRGFIWREVNEDQDKLDTLWGEGYLYTLSLWKDVWSLKNFLYKTPHAEMILSRHNWFQPIEHPRIVLWWVDSGHIPTLEEAHRRLIWLYENGPSYQAFNLKSCDFPTALY